MRLSRLFPSTRREMREGLSRSQLLLEQAGYIRALSAGVYHLLPLGWKVHQKVCAIVYEEMERDGVQNMQLPILQPRELWVRTGRWEKYKLSKTMFVTTESHSGNEFGLAPTAEEAVTALVAAELNSYRQMPLSLHQIGPKFRDEMRPHGGMMRCREFSMSDAYSFDVSAEAMRASFEMYREIYSRIFKRVGLTNCISVQADSGAIGGQGSAEFMAVCGVGEDTLLTCDICDYGANAEKADSNYVRLAQDSDLRPIRHEVTPDVKTVEQLKALFPELTAQNMVKTIILTVNPESDSPYEVAVCIRGDLEINLTKVTNALKADEVVTAAPEVVREVTGAEVGFAGPLGLGNVKQILFDYSTEGMTNFLCGYNTTDHHALDVNFGADVPVPEKFHDLHMATAGHGCPRCVGILQESKGIEVGHVFMLQQGYAKSLGVTFSVEDGTEQIPWMGCYGIGTTRLLHAIVEQNCDDRGIIWPTSVAPYLVHLMAVKASDHTQKVMADALANAFEEAKVELLYDDRDSSPGEKFTDADLIGCPWRVMVGRKAKDGVVEVRNRRSGEVIELPIGSEIGISEIMRLLKEE